MQDEYNMNSKKNHDLDSAKEDAHFSACLGKIIKKMQKKAED